MSGSIKKIWPAGLKLGLRLNGAIKVDDTDMVFSDGGSVADMTAFFRKPEIHALEQIAKTLAATPGHKRLLSLPASIGCEGYTLAAIFRKNAVPGASLQIDLADISQKKLDAAKTGQYHEIFAANIPPDYKDDFFMRGKYLHVHDDLKDMVGPLPAFNVLDMQVPEERYDAIVSLNFLYYLGNRKNRVKAARTLARSTRNIFCISHGIKTGSYDPDGRAVRQAIVKEGFKNDTKFYTPYDAFHAEVFVK